MVNDLPNKYATKICEYTQNFSGGQKQRIAIARALYHKKEFLLIDEGTSALDIDSSIKLEKGILDLKDVTIIMISHKFNISTLTMLDEIYIFDGGVIVESGNFEELVEKDGVFNRLFKTDKVFSY